jgi:RNA polymerase sigma factor (sigma-70 family)
MTAQTTLPLSPQKRPSPEILDLLATAPSTVPFALRVRQLCLSPELEKKIVRQDGRLVGSVGSSGKAAALTVDDEKELATEVLRYRHLFTEYLLGSPKFRQAVLTVIQNIYLFQNRKIFFGTTTASTESERQEALWLFSTSSPPTPLPLAKTFQHLIIARVWSRIIGQSSEQELRDLRFLALQKVVEKLNTLRNVYMILTTGLVKKLATQTNALYRESVSYEDAVQIGGIGIARAAYRYHQSSGVRFSTFAAHWVSREIQRQALDGRLIRISTGSVEGYAKAAKEEDRENLKKFLTIIETATTMAENRFEEYATLSLSELASPATSPVGTVEAGQLRNILLRALDQVLSKKSGDIVRRRFGLPPYQGKEQSVVAISEAYRVTRSSIYQIEQTALKKLHRHLRRELF